MPDLIAQGRKRHQRWRRSLASGESVLLGRSGVPLAVDWDDRISRHHAELRWRHGRLEVRALKNARNAIFFNGEPSDFFSLGPGEHFVIGQTTFTIEEHKACISLVAPTPKLEKSFSPDYLRQLQFRSSRARIDVLARLPEVMAAAASEAELFSRLINLLLSGIATADAAALVVVKEDEEREASEPTIQVLHWDRHPTAVVDLQPSQALIQQATDRGESILHTWSAGSETEFTAAENVDWAFCTPILGETCRGWAIYVAGRFHPGDDAPTSPLEASDLQDDLKFTEIAAQTLRSLKQVQQLQQRQAGLRQFFSPLVLETLANQDPDTALAPRQCEVTVLFCDLRGFSRESERADDLIALLQRVSSSLGLTTKHILANGGVVGDFQGDAVMGFWGWPIEQPDAALRACRAALAIRSDLMQAASGSNDALTGFQMGMGIATGTAVAGKLGTTDQVKVTVFGPVVNLASRLESMTKTLRVPILLDEATALFVRKNSTPEIAQTRELVRVRPAGLETPLMVSELLPPPPEDSFAEYRVPPTNYVPTAKDMAHYAKALEAFQAGRWDEAFAELHHVAAEDRAKDFLVAFIASHSRTPPENWDGTIRLEHK